MESLHRTIYYPPHGVLQGLPPGLSSYCRATPRPAPGCWSNTALPTLYYIEVFAQPAPPSRGQHSIVLQIGPAPSSIPYPVLSYFILFSYGRLCRPLTAVFTTGACLLRQRLCSLWLSWVPRQCQVRSLQFLLTGRESGLLFFPHLSSSGMSYILSGLLFGRQLHTQREGSLSSRVWAVSSTLEVQRAWFAPWNCFASVPIQALNQQHQDQSFHFFLIIRILQWDRNSHHKQWGRMEPKPWVPG